MRLLTMGTGKPFWRLTEVDPDFDDPHTVSPLNKTTREISLAFLERKLGHDPELEARMTPTHPPWSARAVMVDEDYCALDAIQRDNVTLVTDGIRRITETGVEAADGTQHEVDAIVYATGFHASEYLFPMTVTGRGGKTLADLWREGGARAHRFCMAPGFPNLWFVYGPNTVGRAQSELLPRARHPVRAPVPGAPHSRRRRDDRAERGCVPALQRGGRRAQRAEGLERPPRPGLLLDGARSLGGDVALHEPRDLEPSPSTTLGRAGDPMREKAER